MIQNAPSGDSEAPPEAGVIQPWREARERCRISQRQLAEATGLSQAKLSRIESGEREPTLEEQATIRGALRALAPIDSETALGPRHEARRGIRRAFVCPKAGCQQRTHLAPDPYMGGSGPPGEHIPDCTEHGPMVRAANMPYFGQTTEPFPEQNWPEPQVGVEDREAAMRRWESRHK